MKVTKTSDKELYLRQQKNSANLDCEKCPCCGESESLLDYLKNGILDKGVSGGICKTWASGMFKMKSMKVDCYKCNTCGAEWESEPYEWA